MKRTIPEGWYQLGGYCVNRTCGSEFLIARDRMGLFMDAYIVYLVRMLWRMAGLFRSRDGTEQQLPYSALMCKPITGCAVVLRANSHSTHTR